MHIQKSVRIGATPEQVWLALTEPEMTQQWMASVVSDEPLSDGPVGVGFQSKMKIDEGNQVVDYLSEITHYEPTSHLGIKLEGGNLGKGPMHVTYHLVPDANGTLLKYESSWQPHGIMLKLLSPLITRMSNKNAEGEMAALKAFVETSMN